MTRWILLVFGLVLTACNMAPPMSSGSSSSSSSTSTGTGTGGGGGAGVGGSGGAGGAAPMDCTPGEACSIGDCEGRCSTGGACIVDVTIGPDGGATCPKPDGGTICTSPKDCTGLEKPCYNLACDTTGQKTDPSSTVFGCYLLAAPVGSVCEVPLAGDAGVTSGTCATINGGPESCEPA